MTLVLVTDHAWPSLDVEREVLGAAGAELVVAERGDAVELAALARDVDAIMTCFARVPAEVLNVASRCRTVARYGVGVDNINVTRATELGMVVSNVPDYCSEEVADHALMLLLALARRLNGLARLVSSGGWDATAIDTPSRLRGKVLGLVGLGAIGRALVPRAQALGLEVITLRRTGPWLGSDQVTSGAMSRSSGGAPSAAAHWFSRRSSVRTCRPRRCCRAGTRPCRSCRSRPRSHILNGNHSPSEPDRPRVS